MIACLENMAGDNRGKLHHPTTFRNVRPLKKEFLYKSVMGFIHFRFQIICPMIGPIHSPTNDPSNSMYIEIFESLILISN